LTALQKGKFKNLTSGMKSEIKNITAISHTHKFKYLRYIPLFELITLILLQENGFSQESIRSSPANKIETINNSFPDERVMLYPDREIYLCGEDIVFEAFTVEGNWLLPIPSSSILYVELYTQENLVIARGKYFMKNASSSGVIHIPRDISSDLYNIRAYTNYMKNFGVQQFFTKKLKIVNPFLNSGNFQFFPRYGSTKNSEEDSESTKLVASTESFEIDLKTDKKEYGNRENIEVNISARNGNRLPVMTNLVLMAYLSDTGFKTGKKLPYVILGPAHEPIKINSGEGTLKYLPEMKGDIISGKLVYKDNTPAKGIEVLQSFTGKTSWIESYITDDNGNFYFLTDKHDNKGDLILKVQNSDRETSIITDSEFFNDFLPPTTMQLQLTEDEIKLISKEFINIQVDDAFSGENKYKAGNNEKEKLPFYGKEYVEYKFPDYLKLPNMKEFIFEVILGVVYSREKRKDVISIHEESTMNEIGTNPLMLIDGVPVSDASIVIGLPSEKVKYIRVVRNKYFYKDQIFDGILDIITYTNDASSFDLPKGTYRYNFIHPENGMVHIEPETVSNENGRIPLYKNLLYWNSSIATDEEGKAGISFTAPDNAGTFVIKCYGLTPEGMFGAESIEIIVGKK
jgi:hypothetical protein